MDFEGRMLAACGDAVAPCGGRVLSLFQVFAGCACSRAEASLENVAIKRFLAQEENRQTFTACDMAWCGSLVVSSAALSFLFPNCRCQISRLPQTLVAAVGVDGVDQGLVSKRRRPGLQRHQ